jgi:ABC-type phosphate transport system ATPase subunit
MRQYQPMAYPDYGSITIRGARENNLKNVSLDIPKRRITVFTGVSGSASPPWFSAPSRRKAKG